MRIVVKYEIGDKVIYIGNGKEKAWELVKYQEYIIDERIGNGDLSRLGHIEQSEDYVYAVRNLAGWEKISWFEWDDFITLKEYRKRKLQKLNDACTKI